MLALVDKSPSGDGNGPPAVDTGPVEEHRQSIRVFLSMINPDTGYIGDD
jgi:hypothetical protein